MVWKHPGSTLQMWYRYHFSFHIEFGDADVTRTYEGSRIETNVHLQKWQAFLFFTRFELRQRVGDERIRSHLRVVAVANHSSSPQQVYFLFRKMNLRSSECRHSSSAVREFTSDFS